MKRLIFLTLAFSWLLGEFVFAEELEAVPVKFSDYCATFRELTESLVGGDSYDDDDYEDERREFEARVAKLRKKSSEKIVKSIRKCPFGMGGDAEAAVLRERGAEVEGILLQEFEDAENYYLLCLAMILADIPSSRRDEAFLEKLQSLAEKTNDFLKDDYTPPMMLALALNKKHDTIPVLRQYARNANEEISIRAEARIALNLLGESERIAVPQRSFEFAEGVVALKNDIPEQIIKALAAHGLIDNTHGIDSRGKSVITKVEEEKGLTTIEGRLPQGKGQWKIKIGDTTRERVPLYYEEYQGPLAAAGFVGVVERRKDGWACLYWSMTWIS